VLQIWRWIGGLGVILGLFALAAAGEESAGEASFFAGKRLTYLVGSKPGGGYDTYVRLIARHLETQLPETEIVVRNMPGAGHILCANHLYASEPDGLTIGSFNTGLLYAQLRELDGIQFDLRKLSWIGKAAGEPRVFIVGQESGIATLSDLRSDEPRPTAASGVASASHNEQRLLARALGLSIKIITGFSGREGEMAILRGDVVGTLGSYSALRPFVEAGHARILFRVGGGSDFESIAPDARTRVTADDGQDILDLIEAHSELGRLTAAPPGVPRERLAVLRAAYAGALADPALHSEARRLGLPLAPLGGAETAARIERALDQSATTRTRLAAILEDR
jgi:tripartite-type tricarboxylate transporter receptor subunit TctC